MKTDIVTFSYGELELPLNCLNECHHSGSCDLECHIWESQIDWDEQSMKQTDIVKVLNEYCVDTESLTDSEQREYILWLAAGNWQDEQNELS